VDLRKTEEEKMAPWLAAITDSLEVLHKHDENTSGSMSYIMEKANIQFKSVNFMRGRSIQNAIVILQPRIENNLKLLPLCFSWPVVKVKRIFKKIDFFHYSKQSHNGKLLLNIRNLREEYYTKSSNNLTILEAA
jgi:PhoH-like ATPase